MAGGDGRNVQAGVGTITVSWERYMDTRGPVQFSLVRRDRYLRRPCIMHHAQDVIRIAFQEWNIILLHE